MTLWIIIGIVAVAALVRWKMAPTAKVRLGDISALFAKTQSAIKDPSYAQLAFVPASGKFEEDNAVISNSRARKAAWAWNGVSFRLVVSVKNKSSLSLPKVEARARSNGKQKTAIGVFGWKMAIFQR